MMIWNPLSDEDDDLDLDPTPLTGWERLSVVLLSLVILLFFVRYVS